MSGWLWPVCGCAAIAAGVAAVIAPGARTWFQSRGWVDDPGARKIHSRPIPLAGGVSVLVGVMAGLVAAGAFSKVGWLEPIPPASELGRGWLAVFLLSGAGLFLLGWLDDVRELGPWSKLSGQVAVACWVVATGIRLPVFVDWPWVQWCVSAGFFVAVVNAVNFLDNMNGLCAGLGAIAAGQLGWLAGHQGQPGLQLASWAMAGACAGFLPANFPRAQSFLGDAGSHLIGGWLALLTMQACQLTHPRTGAPSLAPLWVLAVPGLDLAQVVISRWWRGQPVYVGDNWHLSHLLTRWGLSRVAAVAVLWAAAAAAGCLACFLQK